MSLSMLWNTLMMSLREIRRNTMRSVLTTLGVIIGVAAVIAMVHLGQGATLRITNDISSLGRNLLFVFPGSGRRTATVTSAPPFDLDDARAIAEEVPGVAGAAPSAGGAGLAVYGNKNWRTGITGTTNDYFRVREWGLASGRVFLPAEELAGSAVCVLGATPRKELFGTADPLGATLRIGAISCEVIGLLNEKGRSTFGDDQDDFIAVPITMFQRRISGNRDVGVIFVSAVSATATTEAQRGIDALLRERRRLADGDDSDFIVRDTKEITELASMATGVLTALLGAIASVSLLVGEEPGVTVVPAKAVRTGPKGSLVFVVKEDKTVAARAVEVERLTGGEAVLAKGVAGGETVVTDGQTKLKDGATVVIAEPAGPATTNAVPANR